MLADMANMVQTGDGEGYDSVFGPLDVEYQTGGGAGNASILGLIDVNSTQRVEGDMLAEIAYLIGKRRYRVEGGGGLLADMAHYMGVSRYYNKSSHQCEQ